MQISIKLPALSSLTLIVTLSSVHACADEKSDEQIADDQVALNVYALTDARYRGISMSDLDPAMQFNLDYRSQSTGIFAGAFLPSTKTTRDDSGNNNFELDFYGGMRLINGPDLAVDIGLLTGYFYSYAAANTTEAFAQLTWQSIKIKYSIALTNFYGFTDSRASNYIELSKSIDLPGDYSIETHIGHQAIKNSTDYSYSDGSIGIAKEWAGLNMMVTLYDTDANRSLYRSDSGKSLGKAGLSFSVMKSF